MQIENEIRMIDTQIAISLGRANYWAQFATSQSNQARTVLNGFSDSEFTSLEKEQDAFDTSNRHLNLAQQFMEEKQALILKLEELEARAHFKG
jgi:hypothetical protein